eukprot:jgi/Undpi1/2304/HiC_scaffold_13.g05688.m1
MYRVHTIHFQKLAWGMNTSAEIEDAVEQEDVEASLGGSLRAPKRGGNGSPSASAAAILRTAAEEPDDGLEPVDAKGLVVSPVDATVAAAVADADDAAAAGADAAAGPAASARGIKEEEGEEGSGGLESGRQPKGVNSRREAFAKVARSRGAHFARPDQKPAAGTGGMAASGGGGGSGSGRGPGNARGRGRAVRVGDGRVEGEAAPELWPGPFAEARRLMDKREEAAALRESVRVHGKAQARSDDDSDPEGEKTPPPIKVEWTPRGRGSRSGKSNAIPSLFQHCLNLLSDNFDHIESLGVGKGGAGIICGGGEGGSGGKTGGCGQQGGRVSVIIFVVGGYPVAPG